MLISVILAMLFSAQTNSARIPIQRIDMTYVYDNTSLAWPEVERFHMELEWNGTIDGGIWLQTEKYSSGSHVGTHIDAPCHFAKGRWCVDKIPLNHLMAPAAVIDITNKAQINRDYMITVEDLRNWERLSGRSLNDTIVLMRSGWGRRWPNWESYSGTSGNDTTLLHFPGMSQEACQWLVNSRRIYGYGVDTLSMDNAVSKDAIVHRTILGANIFGLENVANMEKIPLFGATLHVNPMKIGNASGAPVRIIASFLSTFSADSDEGSISYIS